MKSIFGSTRPVANLLGDEEAAFVASESLRILERSGIRVDSPAAVEIFRRSEGVRIDGKRVFISPSTVEECLASVPPELTIYRPDGTRAFTTGIPGDGITRFGTGVTNTGYQDPFNGNTMPFTREHTRLIASLTSLLDGYDMVSTPGVPSDAPPARLDLLNVADLYSCSNDPLVLLLLGDGVMPSVIALLKQLHGDISTRPFAMTYVNPVTPLILNESTTDKMIASAREGIPVIFSNYGMSGGTTPADSAGTLVVLNAELLAGIIFMQLLRPGAPVIAGSLPAKFNMSTMASIYAPSSYLVNMGCIEMMRRYGVPHCGTSGSGAGWGVDIHSTGELWLNHLTSCMAGAGLVPFVGGNFDSRAFSPGLVIAGDEIIRRIREFMGGFSDAVAPPDIDEIIGLGPGGDYLTSMSTLNSLGVGNGAEPIWPAWGADQWEAAGSPPADSLFAGRVREVMELAAERAESCRSRWSEAEKLAGRV